MTTHKGCWGDNVIGFNQGAALKSWVPEVLCEQTIWTKKLKSLSPRLRELMAMLTYARPENSDTELAFIEKYIDTLPHVTIDGFGNRIVQVGKESPTVCFTAHTDTVDYGAGEKAIELNKRGLIGLDFNSSASCLGADCTAGVWLMRRMILAGKKGLYIFHRAEESGGKGSNWIAENTPELVSGIKAMISLDRKGYDSVITDQATGHCASDTFAASLAMQLPVGFKADPTGSFTDSAFYTHLIPECTNLSVGYNDCHTSRETLNFRFTDILLDRLLKLDYGSLVIERDPVEHDYYGNYPDDWTGYMDYQIGDEPQNSGLSHNKGPPNASNYPAIFDYNLAALVSRYPEAVAVILEQFGINELDIYGEKERLGL